MVISIIGIIYAAFMILSTAAGLVINSLDIPRDPMTKQLLEDKLFFAFSIVSGCIGILVAGVLLASSIGSLMLKPWGRKGMLAYAVLAVITTILSTIFQFAYVLPAMSKAMGAADPRIAQYAMIGGYVGGFCGVAITLVLPAVILYFFTRTKVVNAFNGVFEADPTNFPVTYENPQQPNP
jgi:hypothetical protein